MGKISKNLDFHCIALILGQQPRSQSSRSGGS